MDVSAEAADLVVKEGIQATESAVKLAGTGLKNVAALLLALSYAASDVVALERQILLILFRAAGDLLQRRVPHTGQVAALGPTRLHAGLVLYGFAFDKVADAGHFHFLLKLLS